MILVDTAGLLCYFDRADELHENAVSLYRSADRRITHSYVLAEFVPLCQSRKLDRERVLTFALDLLLSPLIDVVWVDEPLHREAVSFLHGRADKKYSVCDAVSFILMRRHKIREA